MKKEYIKEIVKILMSKDYDFVESVYYFIKGMLSAKGGASR